MLDTRKVALVAWREYLENVRTKAFIFGVILTPLLMGMIFVVPFIFPDEDRHMVIVDGTGELYPLLEAQFAEENKGKTRGRTILVKDPDNLVPPGEGGAAARVKAAEERLQDAILHGRTQAGKGEGQADAEIFGALVIDPDFFTDDIAVRDGSAVRWHTQRPTDRTVVGVISPLLGQLRRPLRTKQLAQRQLGSAEAAARALASVPVAREVLADVAGAGEVEGAQGPIRFHVCDGTGLVLAPVQQAAKQPAPDLAAEIARLVREQPADELAKQLGLPPAQAALLAKLPADQVAAAIARLLPKGRAFELAAWRAPAIEGQERIERVQLLQMGLDPDQVPSAMMDKVAELTEGAPASEEVTLEQAAARFRERVVQGELDAYLVVNRKFLSRDLGAAEGDCVLYLRPGLDPVRVQMLETTLRGVLWVSRFQSEILSANVSPQVSIHNPEKRGERYETKDVAAKVLVPFAFVILLFYGVFGIAQALLNSVIEEKSNRIVEVLLSSLTPTELMLGKIVGTGLVGFTLVALWGIGGYATANVKLGAEFLAVYLRPGLLVFFVIFYVLGFLFLASLIAAVGATCNTIKEAQNYLSVISILYVIPMLTIMPVSQQPDGLMARVLTYIPPLTPFVMMNRLAASRTIAPAEIAASIGILVVAIAAAVWFAARVFRVGILMYGKPPKLSEIWRWIRQG